MRFLSLATTFIATLLFIPFVASLPVLGGHEGSTVRPLVPISIPVNNNVYLQDNSEALREHGYSASLASGYAHSGSNSHLTQVSRTLSTFMPVNINAYLQDNSAALPHQGYSATFASGYSHSGSNSGPSQVSRMFPILW